MLYLYCMQIAPEEWHSNLVVQHTMTIKAILFYSILFWLTSLLTSLFDHPLMVNQLDQQNSRENTPSAGLPSL